MKQPPSISRRLGCWPIFSPPQNQIAAAVAKMIVLRRPPHQLHHYYSKYCRVPSPSSKEALAMVDRFCTAQGPNTLAVSTSTVRELSVKSARKKSKSANKQKLNPNRPEHPER